MNKKIIFDFILNNKKFYGKCFVFLKEFCKPKTIYQINGSSIYKYDKPSNKFYECYESSGFIISRLKEQVEIVKNPKINIENKYKEFRTFQKYLKKFKGLSDCFDHTEKLNRHNILVGKIRCDISHKSLFASNYPKLLKNPEKFAIEIYESLLNKSQNVLNRKRKQLERIKKKFNLKNKETK